MSHNPLTRDSIRQLVNGAESGSFTPAVQVINVKQVNGAQATERFRLILTDGTHYVTSMLATQLNPLVNNGQIAPNTILKVKEFIVNPVQGKRVIILLNADIISQHPLKIGDPVDVETANSTSAPQAAQPMYGNQQGSNIRQPQGNNALKMDNSYNNNSYGGGGYSANRNPSNPYSPAKPRPAYSAPSAPIVHSSSSMNEHITHISQLNMYQNRWTIKGRITSKSPVKTWSNSRGDGSLFSIEVLDASGMDIRATFFKEAVDKFYTMIEVDKVYTLSGGRLKVANAQWNTCKSQFEITFDQNADIHLAQDDASIQHNIFDFKPIAQIVDIAPNTNIDIICVVKSVQPVSSVMSKKTGQELFKSDMTIADDSGAEINLTVWGESAKTAERTFGGQPIVAFKNLRVGDFGGRSLSSSQGAVVHYPPIPRTDQLKNWWVSQGSMVQGKSLSSIGGSGRVVTFDQRKSIQCIKAEQLGYNDKPDWVTVKASFSFVKKDREGGPWYTACANPNEPCRNRPKVTNTADGQYHCEKCNQTYPNCVRRYIFSATLLDDTGNTWVSIFDDQAVTLLKGMTADAMNEKCFGDNFDPDTFEGAFFDVLYTDWVVNIMVKNEFYGEESRVKCTMKSVTPVDYVKESEEMLDALEKLH